MTKQIPHVITASRLVFSSQAYLALGALTFVLFFALYAFVLPATFTGGRVGFVSLQYLSVRLGIFAFSFSILLAFIVPFATYAFRRKRKATNSASSVGSFFTSILPPLLCCSPFLPTIAAFAGSVFPFAFGISGFLQGFVATYENKIYIAIIAILTYSLYQNAKQAEYAAQGTCTC